MTPDGRWIGRLDHIFKEQLDVAEAEVLQLGPVDRHLRAVAGQQETAAVRVVLVDRTLGLVPRRHAGAADVDAAAESLDRGEPGVVAAQLEPPHRRRRDLQRRTLVDLNGLVEQPLAGSGLLEQVRLAELRGQRVEVVPDRHHLGRMRRRVERYVRKAHLLSRCDRRGVHVALVNADRIAVDRAKAGSAGTGEPQPLRQAFLLHRWRKGRETIARCRIQGQDCFLRQIKELRPLDLTLCRAVARLRRSPWRVSSVVRAAES